MKSNRIILGLDPGTNLMGFGIIKRSGEKLKAIQYGVIKMNLDTDFQYAFTSGVRAYMNDKKDYICRQIGNPDGNDIPNKKYYDPRVWLRKGEDAFKIRLNQAFTDLNNINTLK